MIDAMATLEHAKDWGCSYKDLANRVGLSHWRLYAWMDGRISLGKDEQEALASLADAYVTDQKRAVDMVMGNPRGIATTLGIQMTTVRGWKRKMRVPLPWMAAVLEKGPGAPMPKRLSDDDRRSIARRAASARWGDIGPQQRAVLKRIVDVPERAYLYALGNDMVVPRQHIIQTLSQLMRRGRIRVRGWSKNGTIRRKMYVATDEGMAVLAATGSPPKENPGRTARPGLKSGLVSQGGNITSHTL